MMTIQETVSFVMAAGAIGWVFGLGFYLVRRFTHFI